MLTCSTGARNSAPSFERYERLHAAAKLAVDPNVRWCCRTGW